MDLFAKAKTLGIQTEFTDGQGLHRVTDAAALKTILDALPPDLCLRVRALEDLDGLLEIVMDLGRIPEARFAGREFGHLRPGYWRVQAIRDWVRESGEDLQARIAVNTGEALVLLGALYTVAGGVRLTVTGS